MFALRRLDKSGLRKSQPSGSRTRIASFEKLEDRTLLSITLNSSHLQLTLSAGGCVTGIKDPTTQTSYFDASYSAATLITNGQAFYSNSCGPDTP